MPLEFQATKTSTNAPVVEDGTYPADFDGAEVEEHSDWATTKDRYGKPDDGRRIRWNFTVYDQGEPVKLNRLTNLNMNTASKTQPIGVKILRALMTKAEFSAWADGASPLSATALIGRRCQVELVTEEDGEWPKIVAVIAAPKTAKPEPTKSASEEA